MAQFIDQFIRSLQPGEAKAVRRYIKNNVANGEESKTLEVLEAMLAGKEIKYTNLAALNKMKSRIFEKSLDAMLIDNEFISTTYSELDQVAIRLRKQLLQCKMLLRNRTSNKAEAIQHLTSQLIIEAKKYELCYIVSEALTITKYDLAKQNSVTDFDKINKEIAFYDYCEQALVKANDDYFRLILNTHNTQEYSKKELDATIRNSIRRMSQDFRKTKSQTINYYLHIMRFALFERKKEYKLAIRECEKVIVLMKKHPGIKRKERIGFIYDNISHFNAFLGNYEKAILALQKAQTCLTPNSRDFITSKEQEFQVHFYSRNYLKAENCLEIILNHSPSDTGPFKRAKYIYFQACLLFMQKKYKESLALLKKPLEIEKDKERWNIAVRLLTVMIYIELDRQADATRILEALRKYMDRNKANEKIGPRDVLIIKALRELEKGDFEFNPTNTVLNVLMKQLSTENKAMSWEPFSAELIPFHEWLEGRK